MTHHVAQPASAVRVIIAHDHALLASAILGVLDEQPGIVVCGIARTGAEAASLAAREGPDVVLMDVRLPDMPGPVAAVTIRAASPTTAIVFHTMDDSEGALLDAIDAGASAYLKRSATGEQIVETVFRVSRGEVLIPGAYIDAAVARRRSAPIQPLLKARVE